MPDDLRERVADFIEGIDIDEGCWDGWGRPPQINRDNALAMADAILALVRADEAAIRRAALEEAITAIRDARPMPHNLMSVQYAQDIIRALSEKETTDE